jgi:SH3-like domain-containing protein
MPDSRSAPEPSGILRRTGRLLRRPLALLAAALLASALAAPSVFAQAAPLPLPRYASFKSDEVNLRAGPGENYPKQWVYQRSGMPVEIFEEYDTWRRIRDYQGVVGWVNVNLLTGKRTAIVTDTRRTLRDKPGATARPVAELDPGVIGALLECSGDWCRIEVKGHEGWLKRSEIWGVTPNETFKE